MCKFSLVEAEADSPGLKPWVSSTKRLKPRRGERTSVSPLWGLIFFGSPTLGLRPGLLSVVPTEL